MKRVYLVILIFLILTIPLAFIYIDFVSGKAGTLSLDDNINLEDSIIVRELDLDSGEPIRDEEHDNTEGSIIYDNNFEDAIVDFSEIKKFRNSRKADKKLSTIEGFKRKDIRWHLTRYRIRKNDNLWKIARRYGINHRLIINVNNIKDPDRLLPGKYIDIPNRNGIYYKINKGDTLDKISKRFRVKKKRIVSCNGIKGDKIKSGKRIFIPDAVPVIKKKRNRTKRKSYAKSSVKFIWPLRGRITSGFGKRRDPFSGNRRFHCGIDISANVGTPVKAAADGRVIFSGWKKRYGKIVIIRHKGGYITVYAHNSKNIVNKNNIVKRGEPVAYSGMTGAVTGAHLHFEIRKYVTPLNPMRFLR